MDSGKARWTDERAIRESVTSGPFEEVGWTTKVRLTLIGVVAALLAVFIWRGVHGSGGLTKEQTVLASPQGRTVTVGKPAPLFALPVLGSSEALSLDTVEAQHRVVIVNFWATWCHYCKAEMPMLARISAAAGTRLEILGIDDTATESSIRAVSDYVRKSGVHYPILLDETGETFSQYAVHAYPTTYFVNPDGVVTGVVVGELTPTLLRYELAQAGATKGILAAVASATGAGAGVGAQGA